MEGFLLLLVVWSICGFVAAGVWSSKGGSYGAGFLLGAILGFLGLFYVAFAQPEGQVTRSAATGLSDTTAASRRRGTKVCPRCAEEVKAAALVCRFCGHEFPKEAPAGQELAAEKFEGSEVQEVREHAFGVSWGKADNGRVVYKEKDKADWLVYDRVSTPLVPPAGYRP